MPALFQPAAANAQPVRPRRRAEQPGSPTSAGAAQTDRKHSDPALGEWETRLRPRPDGIGIDAGRTSICSTIMLAADLMAVRCAAPGLDSRVDRSALRAWLWSLRHRRMTQVRVRTRCSVVTRIALFCRGIEHRSPIWRRSDAAVASYCFASWPSGGRPADPGQESIRVCVDAQSAAHRSLVHLPRAQSTAEFFGTIPPGAHHAERARGRTGHTRSCVSDVRTAQRAERWNRTRPCVVVVSMLR